MHTPPYQAIWENQKNLSSIILSTAAAACEDCVEPIYPSTEITSQCTDQCVVIACSDPDHNEVNQCHGNGDLPCDLVCDDGTANCTDCDGFDEFLHCCTNYHSYTSETRNDPLGPISYIDMPGDVIMQPAPPLLPPHTGKHVVPSPPAGDGPEILSCMWGNCQASFTSLSELVGHVNVDHLRLPFSAETTHFLASTHPEVSQLACRWRDCSIYPSSESIPNSSSGDHIDEVLRILADHLLRDHIGMDNHHHRTASNMVDDKIDTSLGSLQPLAECASRSTLSTPTAATHRCQWQSCGHSFSTYEDLTSHITVVHVGGGKAQYECFWEGCNRNGKSGFSSKQKICRHLQSHTGHRPYQCKMCQQYFSEAATLQQHMRRHTQEKPYVCDYPGCGKTFAITGALTIHKRIHNGQKPFKCKFCDKAFAESSNLSKHLRTHTGARPYCCTESGCNKSFARPDQLTRHLGVHRKKTPDQKEQSSTVIQ
ncbi:hypothetical protein FPV67DRAFT_1409330 [Lyophyllum atratum]|nr:hypothetical protein FPV67DRAFT_1409330 [Lyophyllum atratum]